MRILKSPSWSVVLVLIAGVVITSLPRSVEAGAVLYRYKATLFDENGSPIGDTPGEDVPGDLFECPSPSGVYSSSLVSRVDNGCLYVDPGVNLHDTTMSPSLRTVDARTYCSNVYQGSHQVEYVQATVQAISAQHEEQWNASLESVSKFKSLVCGFGDEVFVPTAPIDPALTASDLLNADFECAKSYSRCNWASDWNFTRSSTAPDKQIGGSATLGPYGTGANLTYYQDVTLGDGFTNINFPISVESLHSGAEAGKKSYVEIRYLDANKQDIGGFAQPVSSSPRPKVWVSNFATSTAPNGVKYLRVQAKIVDTSAYIDNISVTVNGQKISKINGGYGMPIRPADTLLNAGAEDGNDHWSGYLYNATFSKPSLVTDPFGIIGDLTWNNGTYGSNGMLQQVWINETHKGKPFTIEWMQGTGYQTASGIGAQGYVSAKFYSKDGSEVGSFNNPAAHIRNAGFFFIESLSGIVPPSADFFVVDRYMEFNSPDGGTTGRREYLDNILVKIDGRSLSAFSGNSAEQVNLCQSYVNTVQGPQDNPWWIDGINSNLSSVRVDPQNDGWKKDIHKAYCVPPGSKYLVAQFDLKTNRAWGGFSYTGYDQSGNVVFSSNRWHQSSQNNIPEPIWEVIPVPGNVVSLKTRLIDDADVYTSNSSWNYYSNYTRVVSTSNINFIMNGEIPDVIDRPGQSTKLLNTRANLDTKHWTAVRRSPVKLAIQAFADTYVSGGSVSPDATTSSITVSCSVDNPCQTEPLNNAFKASQQGGELFQDILIGNNAGSSIDLFWKQSYASSSLSSTTGEGAEKTTSTIYSYLEDVDDLRGAAMGLEFYDINNNLIARQMAPREYEGSFFWNDASERQISASLPSNTWKVRVLMDFASPNAAFIDDIRLYIDGERYHVVD